MPFLSFLILFRIIKAEYTPHPTTSFFLFTIYTMFRSTSTGPSKEINGNSNSTTEESNNKNNTEGSSKEMRRSHLRRAVTDVQVPTLAYFQVFQNNSTSRVEAPPPYDEALDLPLPPARFKVAPREEEGRENLPTYSCSIRREAVFERKVELESPFERAYDSMFNSLIPLSNSIPRNFRVEGGRKHNDILKANSFFS